MSMTRRKSSVAWARPALRFRHIHLVQNAEAAKSCALAHGAFRKQTSPPFQRIGADEGRRVHVDVHGNVPHGRPNRAARFSRQYVFSGGLGACQKQVLPAQHRRRRPDVLAVVYKSGFGIRPRTSSATPWASRKERTSASRCLFTPSASSSFQISMTNPSSQRSSSILA